MGELAPLSHGQRDDLVQKWYRIKAEREAGLAGIQDAGERLAKANGSRFILEIASRPDLDTLSQVPLFLLLLIYLRFQGAALPRRRFEVFAALVNHLVREHPVAKLNAASIAESGAAGLVLFNRLLQPDIDTVRLSFTDRIDLSEADEMRLPLMWTAILAGRIKASLAVSTGVSTANDVVKCLLAGADVVMTTSALLRHDIGYMST